MKLKRQQMHSMKNKKREENAPEHAYDSYAKNIMVQKL